METLEFGFPFWAIVIYISVCVFFAIFWESATSFLSRLKNWLKGSRITYYFPAFPARKTEIYRTSFPCRHYNDRKYIDDSVIEINRGPFRRRSAIYGSGIMNWKIENAWRWVDGDSRDCVSLTDTSGLPAEIALRLINTYPSLQAMLDRIAELERQLKESERQRKKRWAGIRAVLELINLDRGKYRSQSSERIRKWLEVVNRKEEFSNESEPGSEMPILDWLSELAEEVPIEKV